METQTVETEQTLDNQVETSQTEAECSEEELSRFFMVLEDKKADIDRAEQAYEQKVRELAEVAGKTFCYQGQWYQVSQRYNKPRGRYVPFVKRLPGRPKSWLTGMPKGGWHQNTEEDQSNGASTNGNGASEEHFQAPAQENVHDSSVVLD